MPELIILVCIVLGSVSLLSTRTMWYLRTGWKFRDAEPSDLALVMERVVGVVLLVLAAVLGIMIS